MRALGLLFVVSLGSCYEPPRPSYTALRETVVLVGDLTEAERYAEAESLATRWLAQDYPEAVASLDPVQDRLYESRDLTGADTSAAYMIARQAQARWHLGDTVGTVEAYSRVLPYRALMTDSTASRTLRWMAWAASFGDPEEGLRLMDTAERWARERGLNREAAEVLRCKAELILRMESEDIAPEAVGVDPRGHRVSPTDFLVAALVLLALEVCWYIYTARRGSRRRTLNLYPYRR